MVCVPQSDEQPLLQVDSLPNAAATDGTTTVADVEAVEEKTAMCMVHDYTARSSHEGPCIIFVKYTSTVDDLYQQIATQLKHQETDFEVNLKSEALFRKTPSTKLPDAGIRFDGDRNLLTLTDVIKSKKKYILPVTKAFQEEDVANEAENGQATATAVASTSADDLNFCGHVAPVPVPAIETHEKKYVGLVNQAMTCYLNSLLQSLYMTPEFRNALYKWEFDGKDEDSRRKSIPFQLQRLFLKLQTSNKNAVETTDLTRSFGWDSSDSWTQHDVQELCRVMFDALEHKFRKTEQADLINRLYQGKMIDYVKCMECGRENIREDTFLDIPLPIRPFGKETAYGSVEDALSGFVEPETLDGSNQYACENCNKKTDAKKGLKFMKIPYLLTLHLMRFDFDYNSLHRLKLNDKVVFPEILDMNPFITSTSTGNKESQNEKANNGVEPNAETPDAEAPKAENVEAKESAEAEAVDSAEKPAETVAENPAAPSNENGSSEAPVVNGKTKAETNGGEVEDDVFENGEAAACINDINEKNARRNEEKGPYMYELYAILIHSGNASGGHYYAYIKDFHTGQWYCFNDQNVTTITSDDIRKTYGGSRSYYNSGYSPSTSAYMLMYRQIDKERNAEVMKLDEFPEHIKVSQLAAMQNKDGDGYSWDYLVDTVKLKVYCYLPSGDRQTHCKLNCLGSLSQKEVLQKAHEELKLLEYPIEQCRLVAYDGSQHMITGGLHEHEEDTIGNIVTALDGNQTFLLQVKSTEEPWQPFVAGDTIARVHTIDLTTEEVVGPHLIPVNCKSDVADFKKLLQTKLPATFGTVPTEEISIVLEKYSSESLCTLMEFSRLFDSDSYVCTVKKVFVAVNKEADKPFTSTKLFKMIDRIQNIINLEISLPDFETEELEEMEIPLLSASNRQKTDDSADDASALSTSSCSLNAESNADSTPTSAPARPQSSLQLNPPTDLPGTEEDPATSTDQSASEDSSLTDSDRTLVGDQENLLVTLSSPSDESAGADGQAMSSPDDPPPQDKISKDEDDWAEGDGARVAHMRPQNFTYFKATPFEESSRRWLQVQVDKRASMVWLKRHLESFVGVPCDYFKVVKSNDEYDYTSLSPSFRDGDKINVRLGRALRKGEYSGKVFKLTPNDVDPIKFLLNCTLSNGMLVSDAKKQILKDLKRKNDIEIDFEKCRLRKKSWKNPGQVYYDHQKFEESMCLMSNWELFLQEMPDSFLHRTEEDPLPELVLFVRKLSLSAMTIGPFEEVDLPSAAGHELHAKLSGLSGIPAENIEIAKALGSFPCDISLLTVNSELEWISSPATLNEWPFNIYEDGHVILYRDSKEPVKELTAEERKELERAENSRRPRVGWTFTPRKERGLRIYLDPTPPKSIAPTDPSEM